MRLQAYGMGYGSIRSYKPSLLISFYFLIRYLQCWFSYILPGYITDKFGDLLSRS